MSRHLMSRYSRWLTCALVAWPAFALSQEPAPPAVVPAPAPAGEAAPVPELPTAQPVELFFAQGAAGLRPQAVRVVEAPAESAAPTPEYWMGVQLEPLPEIIKSQLKLERGMVVVHVFPDSPAASAELKPHDIVLKAGDKDIQAPEDLVQAVNDSKDKELALIVLRSGTENTLRVTPAKRPVTNVPVSPETPYADVVTQVLQLGQQNPGGDVQLFAVRPGGVFAYAQAGLPDNLDVRIEKRGNKPATVKVTRIQEGEDQTWEVTEDKLGELPEDVRGHVQQMLHGPQPRRLAARLPEAQGQQAQAHARMQEAQNQLSRRLGEYRVQVKPRMALPAGVAPHAVRMPQALPPQADSGIQAKLDAILRKLDENEDSAIQRLDNEIKALRKEVEELRQEKK